METWLPIAIVRLLPAYGRADKRAMAADDAARRSGPAPAGLNPSSRARGCQCGCSVSASGHFRRFRRGLSVG